jgi:hypothetical protein
LGAELLTYAHQPRRAPVLVRGDLSVATMGATGLADDERRMCAAAEAVVAVSGLRDRRVRRPGDWHGRAGGWLA